MLRIHARASSSGITSQLLVDADQNWARLTLDTRPMYRVPAEEWAQFTSQIISTTPLPPNLFADRWSTLEVQREGSAFLRQGERQQLLISSVHLAAQIPMEAIFGEDSFDTFVGAVVFHGRHFRDPRGNFLYVPSSGIQVQLLNDPGKSREMCAVGYLFDFESTDVEGNIVRLFYRPYNTGFATSSRWPEDLQKLWRQIEDERHRE